MKKNYNQPKMETIVLPKQALMDFQASPNLDPHGDEIND